MGPCSGAALRLSWPGQTSSHFGVRWVPTTPRWCGFPLMTITNLTSLGSNTGQLEFDHYPAILDDVSWTKGAHQFMFGFEARFQRIGGGAGSNTVGTIAFGSTAA